MKLKNLLTELNSISDEYVKIVGDLEITGLTLDSRMVKPGHLFVALNGAKQHGLIHISEAVAKGASAVIFDTAGDGKSFKENTAVIPAIPVENLSSILGELAARFYGYPSEKLNVIGITGTNGKTSCSQFLGQVLDSCGIIGTLGWGDWGKLNKTFNTTPDAFAVQQMLAEFVRQKKKIVAMEVSSHGLDQERVNGVSFKGAIFTNLTRDHLDYHGTMSAYLAAKLKLFQVPELKFAVLNMDDENCHQFISAIPKNVDIWGVSIQGSVFENVMPVLAKDIRHTVSGIEIDVRWQGEIQRITAPLYGDFNAENLLSVIATMLALGHDLEMIKEKLKVIKPVTGRMELCTTNAVNEFNVFVDYAHTPDALLRVLKSLRKHCEHELWVVFGCGGNRDTGKRPQMGAIAEQWADRVIVTDDNPRDESNVAIANEILSGCHSDKVIVIQDRKQAIHHAITNAARNDCIVIAGKGHEDYQEIKGVQHPFNDKQIAEKALNIRFELQ